MSPPTLSRGISPQLSIMSAGTRHSPWKCLGKQERLQHTEDKCGLTMKFLVSGAERRPGVLGSSPGYFTNSVSFQPIVPGMAVMGPEQDSASPGGVDSLQETETKQVHK